MNRIIKHYLELLPDKPYLYLQYYKNFHCLPNLKNPKSFCEKIMWLKLHDKNPLYTTIVDKYLVKDYVASIIGREYIIPTYGVWQTTDEIDWDSLPSQFVIKTNHSGGNNGVIICKNKATFNKKDAIKRLNESLLVNSFYYAREWPYKNIKKCILAEKFITSKSVDTTAQELTDYKFFCFNGDPKFCQVIRNRQSFETIDFYDMEWKHQEFVGLNTNAHNGKTPVNRPNNLDNIIQICKSLSKGFPFVRVDLYIVDNKEYFGELTLYPAGGIGTFSPPKWNNILGELIKL